MIPMVYETRSFTMHKNQFQLWINLFRCGYSASKTTVFSQSNAIHVLWNDVLTRMTCLHGDDGDTTKTVLFYDLENNDFLIVN